MIGDQADIVRRIKATLPTGWFSDVTPLLDSLLTGVGNAWSWVYSLIDITTQQTRIGTASSIWLDLIATDYFGAALPRSTRESDDHYRQRISSSLLKERTTRSAIESTLTGLTGRIPKIFEPGSCRDAGGYGVIPGNTGGLGYNVVGAWGNLNLPYQCFITAFRPLGAGISQVNGWNCAAGGYSIGSIEYANIDLMETRVSDAEILSAISLSLPVATTAWTRISD